MRSNILRVEDHADDEAPALRALTQVNMLIPTPRGLAPGWDKGRLSR